MFQAKRLGAFSRNKINFRKIFTWTADVHVTVRGWGYENAECRLQNEEGAGKPPVADWQQVPRAVYKSYDNSTNLTSFFKHLFETNERRRPLFTLHSRP